ncbi:MAG: hypothetical protein LBE62_02095 [Azonexus sp.]|nr:hypothetical protein [Azonexus sp.]
MNDIEPTSLSELFGQPVIAAVDTRLLVESGKNHVCCLARDKDVQAKRAIEISETAALTYLQGEDATRTSGREK